MDESFLGDFGGIVVTLTAAGPDTGNPNITDPQWTERCHAYLTEHRFSGNCFDCEFWIC